MISKVDILTFTNNKVVIDISGWETLSIQIIGGSGTRTIQGTNDDGSITGDTVGSAGDATNFNAVYATPLNTSAGTPVNTITDSALYRIYPICFKYLQIGDGSTAVATKILVFKTKPV